MPDAERPHRGREAVRLGSDGSVHPHGLEDVRRFGDAGLVEGPPNQPSDAVRGQESPGVGLVRQDGAVRASGLRPGCALIPGTR